MMAKAKKMELPTVDEAAIEQQEVVSEQLAERAEPAAVETAELAIQWKTIRVPVLNGRVPPQLTGTPRLDMRQISGKQRRALHNLCDALCANGDILMNGQRVARYRGRAIMWLLEQIGD